MTFFQFISLGLIAALAVYILVERYRLRDFNHMSADLTEGVLMSTYCRGTTHIRIVSDGEGYSKPIATPKSPQCGEPEQTQNSGGTKDS